MLIETGRCSREQLSVFLGPVDPYTISGLASSAPLNQPGLKYAYPGTGRERDKVRVVPR